jgi:LPS-assembly lipoprotein
LFDGNDLMNGSRPLARAYLGTLLLGLAGCGFHLAGNRMLPPPLDSVYIETVVPYRVSEPPVEVALRSRLVRRGGVVTSRAGDAKCILRLTKLDERREVLSAGLDGKALEYLLTTRVSYELTSGKDVLVPLDTLTVSRDYSFNAEQVLAKEAEEARLREFIQDEIAELLLLRLEATLSSRPASVTPTTVPAS